MPQMMPLMWVMLLMLTISSLILTISFIYFLARPML